MRGLLVVTAAALLCAGCTVAPPPAPTAAQLAEHHAQVMRATWLGIGMTGQPPAVEHEQPGTEQQAAELIDDCIRTAGLLNYEWGFDGQRYRLYGAFGADMSDPAVLMGFYTCTARFAYFGETFHTPEQLDYLYDYYQEWVTPCLQRQGVVLQKVPTREEFHHQGGTWSPYDAVELDEYERVFMACEDGLPADH